MDVTALLEGGAAGVAIATSVGKGGGYVLRKAKVMRDSRRRPEKVWRTMGIAIGHRLPDGSSVPGGVYHCTRDHHVLDVDYQRAAAKCPACGRQYEPQFPPRIVPRAS